ncbi:MAG: hypothetical protein PHQ59_00675 [Candidatus Daviesbacteria bacterium]|nr:hypothetical protein [Candidatus Daviesbacteria bacterium]
MPEFYHKPSEKNNDIRDLDDDPVRTYLTWTAPSRPFRKRDRSFFTTIAIIFVLLILISFFAREYIFIGVLFAFAFMVYVLAFVPPEDVQYKISTQGITIGDHFYFWTDLNSFWFSEKEGYQILNVLTDLRFPGQLIILIQKDQLEEIKKVVARYLPFHEIAPKNLMDSWASSLQKHFPLENPQK